MKHLTPPPPWDEAPAPSGAGGGVPIAAARGAIWIPAAGVVRWWRRFARSRGAVFGLATLLALVGTAIFADGLAPYDPLAQGVGPPLVGPSLAHWAGTDSFGRDMLSRMIHGARIALAVGLFSVLLSMIVGVTLGLVAGYYGGVVDAVIMRVMDGLFAFPVIFLAIATMAIMGFGVRNVIVAVAIGLIPPFARVTRGDVLAVKEEPYVEAARLAGVGTLAILLRHVLPNVLAPIIVQAALYVSGAILTEAGLSFLGLGPPPPTPVWGSMIAEGRNFIVMAPHVSTIPGLVLTVSVIGLNLLGDGLRDTLDPRQAMTLGGSGAGGERRTVLEVRDLTVAFPSDDGWLRAVDGVSFDVCQGEIVGLVGESGAGKSLTSEALLRLVRCPPARVTGTVRFRGQDLLALPEPALERIRGRDLAMIFQNPSASLNPVFRVGDQVYEAMALHQTEPGRTLRQRVVEILGRVGIPAADVRQHDYPHQFSGGMAQRVMIGMAMACAPSLLVADEPTTALDVTIQAQVLALIRRLARETGTAVLLVSHDLGIVSQMCHRVLVMYAGRIVEAGPVSVLFRAPAHPYTRGLLGCLPRPDGAGRLDAIPGTMPGLRAIPRGCRFHPRCRIAEARCADESPALRPVATDHAAACHLAGT